jgi:LAO/AO transport system kinase
MRLFLCAQYNFMWQQLLQDLQNGNIKALARAISYVENEGPGYEAMLQALPGREAAVVGITGPPGAGKSTLVDALIGQLVQEGKKIAVLCVDPSSPFNMGAVLGDRIRMSDWYTNPQVYIRSLATRGSMGGLHPKIIEITDLLKAAGFDYILVETVGVGQSEIEIAGLADTTVVVVVPEAGDEVQTMKAGLMEIADIFVVNKSDRPDADAFVRNLRLMLAPTFRSHQQEVAIVKTVASARTGIEELNRQIQKHREGPQKQDRKYWLLAERAWYLIEQHKMKAISKEQLKKRIEQQPQEGFNLYQFIQSYL